MQDPGIPSNEAERLATLHRFNILDTPRSDRFDRYTRISAKIFDMPIAIISLVDRYRQWFKSTEGFDGEETPRSVSFCGHAILGDDIFEVRNARRDPRFRDNPLVVDRPNIRFYAGAPLEAPNGHKLGTLCIIDRVPRRLSDEEKTMLKNLADMVVGEIVNYVDTETGLSNRNALIVEISKFFDRPIAERDFSLLLFDINDVLSEPKCVESGKSPGETFAQLLRTHFPEALSIAYMGANNFCVLLRNDESSYEPAALNRLSIEARELLCGENDCSLLSVLVGRVEYDPLRFSTVEDMIHEADEMLVRREKQPLPRIPEKNRFLDALTRWRRTTF